MLISDTHKFLFIAIPKAASQTIRTIFRKYATDEHVGTGGGVSIPHKSKYPEFKDFNHGHLSIMQIKDVINISNYYTFCVFRNPYSRAVSLWSFMTRNYIIKPNILDFYIDFYNNPQNMTSILFKPQSYFITNNDGDVAVDYIIKFEDMEAGINSVLNHLHINEHLSDEAIPTINKSNHDDYQKYYDDNPELKSLIDTIYKDDIIIFNNLNNK